MNRKQLCKPCVFYGFPYSFYTNAAFSLTGSDHQTPVTDFVDHTGGFVGDGAPCGLSPQTNGMPVIQAKTAANAAVFAFCCLRMFDFLVHHSLDMFRQWIFSTRTISGVIIQKISFRFFVFIVGISELNIFHTRYNVTGR